MKDLVGWFVHNPVAANLMMLTVVAGGAISTLSMRREVFPEFRANSVAITVPFPGASPEEVEESICTRVEEEVQSVDGIDKIRSVAAEGAGVVTVELVSGTDVARALDDIKSRIDALDTLPEDAEEPIVTEVLQRRQTISVAVSGDLDERSLRVIGQRVRDDIADLEGITQVELSVARPYEISIEVSEAAMRRHRITFDEVVRAVQQSSIDLPGGSIKTTGGEILLRTDGQAETGTQFEDLTLWSNPDGSRLRLGDVARVVDGFEDTDEFARFDGKPAVLVDVFRVGDQDALDIASAVRDYVATARQRMPAGVELTTWRDESLLLRSRLDLLISNGIQGFVLVFAVLALFLRLELALWVSVGIPISFLGALWLMPMFGVSVNMLSLFAFILVLGIVVDDAIVVGENIYTQSRSGKHTGVRAAVIGAQEVAVPVTFAVLTTIAAFLPMLNVPGPIGQLWAVIPIVVISTLVFSMIESKLVLPAHLRHLSARTPTGVWGRFQDRFASGLEAFAERVYRPVLHAALERRWLAIAIATTIIVLTVALLASGRVRFVFFPPVDGDNVALDLTLPAGTPVAHTAAEMRRLEQAAMQLRQEFPGQVDHIMTTVGSQPFRKSQEEGPGRIAQSSNAGSQFGEVNIQLAPSEVRSVSSKQIENRWRELAGPVPGAVETKFSSSMLTIGADLDIQLRGDDHDALLAAIAALEAKVATYPGVADVSNSFRAGKAQIELELRGAAEPLGLRLADLARQVRHGFYGAEAQRVQRGRDDIKVMIRYPEADRRTLGGLDDMRIRTAGGDEVPFATVADVRLGRGAASITRIDRKRAISVTAEIDEDAGAAADANTVLADLQREFLPRLCADHSGVGYSFEGERKQQQDTLGGIGTGSVFALLLIFALLAVPFRSYLQPLIVMSVIPFGLVGAVMGHVIMGLDLSVLSLFGIVALAGVVVNDSLVLVDFVNRWRERGGELLPAIGEAGVARFRPIMLTSLTTFAGLTPLLFERSVQAKFLVPMAVSLAFGVMFATLITLIMVPVAYLVLEDVRRGFAWLWGRSTRA